MNPFPQLAVGPFAGFRLRAPVSDQTAAGAADLVAIPGEVAVLAVAKVVVFHHLSQPNALKYEMFETSTRLEPGQ